MSSVYSQERNLEFPKRPRKHHFRYPVASLILSTVGAYRSLQMARANFPIWGAPGDGNLFLIGALLFLVLSLIALASYFWVMKAWIDYAGDRAEAKLEAAQTLVTATPGKEAAGRHV